MTEEVRIRPMEILDKARAVIDSEGFDALVEITAYHGFRSHKPLEVIRREGLTYPLRTWVNARNVIYEALDYFRIKRGLNVRMLASVLSEIRLPDRLTLCLTLYKDTVEGWAQRSPEFFSLAFDGLIPFKELADYRRTKFGRPLAMITRINTRAGEVYFRSADIHTGKKCFFPNEILWVGELTGVY